MYCSVRYFAEYNIIFLFLNVGDGFSATFRCFDSVNSWQKVSLGKYLVCFLDHLYMAYDVFWRIINLKNKKIVDIQVIDLSGFVKADLHYTTFA